MKIINELNTPWRGRRPVVLAAGFFDGLHIGHQKVINAALTRAREIGGEAWVMTFDRHPLKLLHAKAVPPLLTCHRHKMVLLEKMGLHGCLVIPFTHEVAELPHEAFAAQLHAEMPRLAELFIGTNWRFGRHAKGTPAHMSSLGRKYGFKVTTLRPVLRNRKPVSSTRIRSMIIQGKLDDARPLLGRPFSVFGTVGHGAAIGHKLGFPTANLDYHNEAIPPEGVYIVDALLYGPDASLLHSSSHARWRKMKAVRGILNLGRRPTLRSAPPIRPVMEVHLLAQAGNLYEQDIEVFFIKRLRAERKFTDMDELREQIALDAQLALDLI